MSGVHSTRGSAPVLGARRIDTMGGTSNLFKDLENTIRLFGMFVVRILLNRVVREHSRIIAVA